MTSSITYKDWLDHAIVTLKAVSDSPQLDARLLLCHVLQISPTSVLAWPDRVIPKQSMGELDTILSRRLAGEPVAYLLGTAEFWGLRLKVDSSVLVPRTETELLVETALEKVRSDYISHPKILDLGTGSGAIAIALASELTRASITAVDLSTDAITTAAANAELHKLSNIQFIHSNWFDELDEVLDYDIIISNPPYVAEHDPHLKYLQHEPLMALTSANSGMADIEQLIVISSTYLTNNGWLMIEHGFDQAQKVRQQMQLSDFRNIMSLTDLAQHERITIGQNPI